MENTMENKMSLRDYYNILVYTCKLCEENSDNEQAMEMFADAAFQLAHANCGYLFPEDLYVDDYLTDNAAAIPEEGTTVTGIKEDKE